MVLVPYPCGAAAAYHGIVPIALTFDRCRESASPKQFHTVSERLSARLQTR